MFMHEGEGHNYGTLRYISLCVSAGSVVYMCIIQIYVYMYMYVFMYMYILYIIHNYCTCTCVHV